MEGLCIGKATLVARRVWKKEVQWLKPAQKEKSVRRRVGSSRSTSIYTKAVEFQSVAKYDASLCVPLAWKLKIIIRARLGAKITNVTSLKSCLTS